MHPLHMSITDAHYRRRAAANLLQSLYGLRLLISTIEHMYILAHYTNLTALWKVIKLG